MKKREPVSHIMSKQVEVIHPHQNLYEAREKMDQAGIRHLPVVDGPNIIGIVSRTDVMRASYGLNRDQEAANKKALQLISVRDAMSPDPVTVADDTPIREVAEMLAEQDFSAVPVTHAGQLAGMVSTSDLIRFLLEQY